MFNTPCQVSSTSSANSTKNSTSQCSFFFFWFNKSCYKECEMCPRECPHHLPIIFPPPPKGKIWNPWRLSQLRVLREVVSLNAHGRYPVAPSPISTKHGWISIVSSWTCPDFVFNPSELAGRNRRRSSKFWYVLMISMKKLRCPAKGLTFSDSELHLQKKHTQNLEGLCGCSKKYTGRFQNIAK